MQLTINEREKVRQQTETAMRERLEARRPDAAAYESGESRAERMISQTLTWSKAAVPIIALLAALASSVRTVQVVSGIYTDAGSHAIGVAIAAAAFTLSAEGALFVLALAQAGENMKRRREQRPRHVASLARAWEGVQVRIGIREPRRYDELPEHGGRLGLVIGLALVFTLSTNLYLGLAPLVDEMGSSSLQAFIASLVDAPARLQMVFIVDLSAALFAPLVAFAAGHLTAGFAADIAATSEAGRRAYDRDLAAWRTAMADPLATDEGAELLTEYTDLKQQRKAAQAAARRQRNQPSQAESAAIRADLETTATDDEDTQEAAPVNPT